MGTVNNAENILLVSGRHNTTGKNFLFLKVSLFIMGKLKKRIAKRVKIDRRHIILTGIAMIVFFSLIAYFAGHKNHEEVPTESKRITVREPAVAGMFYEASAEKLEKSVQGFLSIARAGPVDGKVVAMISPHAGYRYSGLTAASGYKHLEGSSYEQVIILGPSHRAAFKGAAIINATHYKTPLGLVEISDDAALISKDLLKEALLVQDNKIHKEEHSLEVQLPFLQSMLSDFTLIPIVIGGKTNYEDLVTIADILKRYADADTLVVVSSDFTHYGPQYGYTPFKDKQNENLRKLAEQASVPIINLDSEGFNEHCSTTKDTICGRSPIIILLNIFKDTDTEVRVAHFDTSGRMLGDYSNSVTYLSFVFIQDIQENKEALSEENQEFLLELARQTLESYVREGKTPKLNEDFVPEELSGEKGCFVTLEKNHQLRGCIGHIIPQESLYECVMENAVNAAAHDTRFNKVTPDELDDIEIEISMLTVPTEIEFSSGEDLKNRLTPNVDGVILRQGFRQSTYLPQVWETLPQKEKFLTQLCKKGGMSSDCWKDTRSQVLTYQAFVFKESLSSP